MHRRPGIRGRWLRLACLGLLLGLLDGSLLGPSVHGGRAVAQDVQAPPNPGLPQSTPQNSGPLGPPRAGQEQDPLAHRVETTMAERRNAERQKMLVADTDRLLTLAQQLKYEVDKSDKNMLSIDVVKRAEQIEKLARSVKEKMRGN